MNLQRITKRKPKAPAATSALMSGRAVAAGQRAIPECGAILDRPGLAAELARIAGRAGSPEAARGPIREALKRYMTDGRAEIRRRFEEANEGGPAVRELAWLMDQVVGALHDVTVERLYPAHNLTTGEAIAVVAVGGYGRGELAPHSDIDLLFLLPYKQTPRGEQVVEYLLYTLWDLGLKVGHATRSIDECIRQVKADVTIRTAILEARPLCGDAALFEELRRRFVEEVVAGTVLEFVEAKLEEAEARHRRMGDSRYVVEPNIKEGKGALRDLHTLGWIAKYAYQVDNPVDLAERGVLSAEEARLFVKAREFFWTLRCHLHWLTGRAEERLTFDVQQEIARRMGYTDHAGTIGVERLMRHYYLFAKDVGALTRIFCTAVEAEHRRRPRRWLPRWSLRRRDLGGFVLDGERLAQPDDGIFDRDPVALIRLFWVTLDSGLDIHPRLMRLVTRRLALVDARLKADPEANRLFLDVLATRDGGERVLRLMHEAGVLGRFVPDFGRVAALMQYDMYHTYTVDEHTIIAMGILHRIEAGGLAEIAPIATEVIHKVASRRALYVALFLHDIAKGRGGDHSVLGERVALRLCPRLGLDAEEVETVAWLVRHHLAMSNVAFKRDLNDPSTISAFADLVQSPERLRLLLVLTVADIRAVGPGTWNSWKAALLRELYWRTEERLTGSAEGAGQSARIAVAQEALRRELADWPEEDFEAHLARGYPSYWLSLDTTHHAYHARLVREAEASGAPLTVDTRVDARAGVTEVTIYTSDHPGLFSRIAGAMACAGANIVDARIFTLTNGMALDGFTIQDENRQAFERPDKLARLSSAIERCLAGTLKPEVELAKRMQAIPSRTRVFHVPPRVLVDNKASATHTVIEVNGRDRPGLLHALTRALARVSVQISTAKISTYGEKVIDVFYVKDLFGLKIEHERKLREIRDALMAVLEEREPAPEAAKKAPARPRRRRQPAPAA